MIGPPEDLVRETKGEGDRSQTRYFLYHAFQFALALMALVAIGLAWDLWSYERWGQLLEGALWLVGIFVGGAVGRRGMDAYRDRGQVRPPRS